MVGPKDPSVRGVKGEQAKLVKLVKWLRTAEALGNEHSTCSRKKYGCIILRPDFSVVSIGYNGAPPGYPHCEDGSCPRAQENSISGSSYENCIAVHAEQNALIRAPYDGLRGTTLIVNGPPCFTCARLIAGAGISLVVHKHDPSYPSFGTCKRFMQDNGVEVITIDIPEEA